MTDDFSSRGEWLKIETQDAPRGRAIIFGFGRPHGWRDVPRWLWFADLWVGYVPILRTAVLLDVLGWWLAGG